MRLTLETDSAALTERYDREESFSGLTLDPDADAGMLEAIARYHGTFEYGALVLEKIVAHRHCNLELLELVLELDPSPEWSASVENTVVTSGKAGSRHQSVREHVEYALLLDDLSKADEDEFMALYRRYEDHPTLGYGLCHYLATHGDPPKAVLEDIASHGGPFGEQARVRLREGQ